MISAFEYFSGTDIDSDMLRQMDRIVSGQEMSDRIKAEMAKLAIQPVTPETSLASLMSYEIPAPEGFHPGMLPPPPPFFSMGRTEDVVDLDDSDDDPSDWSDDYSDDPSDWSDDYSDEDFDDDWSDDYSDNECDDFDDSDSSDWFDDYVDGADEITDCYEDFVDDEPIYADVDSESCDEPIESDLQGATFPQAWIDTAMELAVLRDMVKVLGSINGFRVIKANPSAEIISEEVMTIANALSNAIKNGEPVILAIGQSAVDAIGRIPTSDKTASVESVDVSEECISTNDWDSGIWRLYVAETHRILSQHTNSITATGERTEVRSLHCASP